MLAVLPGPLRGRCEGAVKTKTIPFLKGEFAGACDPCWNLGGVLPVVTLKVGGTHGFFRVLGGRF